SKAGHCEMYAKAIGEKTNIEVIDFSIHTPSETDEVIFITWISAGKIVGLKKIRQKCQISQLIALGVRYYSEDELLTLKHKNGVQSNLPFFKAQGGVVKSQTNPILNMLIFNLVINLTVKLLAKQENLLPYSVYLEKEYKGQDVHILDIDVDKAIEILHLQD
ncbi:MAG: hypothetical protein WCR33_06570, partial [Bacilli bacterium]